MQPSTSSGFYPPPKGGAAAIPSRRCAASCPTSTRIAIAPVVPMRISPAVVGEERSAGFRPFPRPAPPRVDRDSLPRDSESVRIATHLGLVEVHLGHLAQRCAGRLTGLTSRLLHSVSSQCPDAAILVSPWSATWPEASVQS